MSQFKNDWSQGDWKFSRIGSSKYYELTYEGNTTYPGALPTPTALIEAVSADLPVPFPHRMVSIQLYKTQTTFAHAYAVYNFAMDKRLTTIPNFPHVSVNVYKAFSLTAENMKIAFAPEDAISKPCTYTLYFTADTDHLLYPIIIVERLEEVTDFA